jgi:hypothetical protein
MTDKKKDNRYTVDMDEVMKNFKTLMEMPIPRDERNDNIIAFILSFTPPVGTFLYERPDIFRRLLHDLQVTTQQNMLFRYLFLYLEGYTINHDQIIWLADALQTHFRRTQVVTLKRSLKSLAIKSKSKGKFLRGLGSVKFPSPMDFPEFWTTGRQSGRGSYASGALANSHDILDEIDARSSVYYNHVDETSIFSAAADSSWSGTAGLPTDEDDADFEAAIRASLAD